MVDGVKREQFPLSDGNELTIIRTEHHDRVDLKFLINTERECILHWGLGRSEHGKWVRADEGSWPEGSVPAGEGAVQTPFKRMEKGAMLSLTLPRSYTHPFMNFVLYYPDTKEWDNNRGMDYHIRLTEPVYPDINRFKDLLLGDIIYNEEFDIEGEGKLIVNVMVYDSNYRVVFISSLFEGLIMHWGVSKEMPFEWIMPDRGIIPQGSVITDGAVESPFEVREGAGVLVMDFKEHESPLGIVFVLRLMDENRWIKYRGGNFYIPIRELNEKGRYPGSPEFSRMADEIIRAEMGKHSWTLMHRFNLCHDLLERIGGKEEGFALIFVWLRYSSLRQLDWQRNYNTKPRELSHSQDRLTRRLASLYREYPENRHIIRLIMTTLGRGGEGQRIRDEILHIMHKYHIKEISGTFLEEWHQKLHNNTTPDDVVICEAYLEFLRSNGDLERFYNALKAGGVTKERLESFERPIVTPPEFMPHIKDALIGEFENYLRLLKSVHSGTDLESTVDTSLYLLDHEMREALRFIIDSHKQGTQLDQVIESITSLRRSLSEKISSESDVRLRDLIYLDLALEEHLRVMVEREIHQVREESLLIKLIDQTLENVRLINETPELRLCQRHLRKIMEYDTNRIDQALLLLSLIDRLSREISCMNDKYYSLLQEKAEYLGRSFNADDWVIRMFSEEVIRGRLTFTLSQLMGHLDSILRKIAKYGDWQIISRADVSGVIEFVESLRSVQERNFTRPTIVISDEVRGDEEPPEGLRAVITSERVDLIAHVAIRARNSGILFAVCYNPETYNHLKAMTGEEVTLRVTPSGDIEIAEGKRETDQTYKVNIQGLKKMKIKKHPPCVVGLDRFSEDLVGKKSFNLRKMRDALPSWISVPQSIAVPFGVYERIMSYDLNSGIREEIEEHIERLEKDTDLSLLNEIRSLIMKLEAPPEFISSLRITMEEYGLPWHYEWERLWECIKGVWASVWNERAFVNRNKYGIPHGDIHMAVLIQELVKADYAFVLHTVNPINGSYDELFGEIVKGLGESLVGNHPGRALSFVYSKKTEDIEILTYPSKKISLIGSGLIFRSDSNAEDIEGYSGAGLYESVYLDPPKELMIDYTGDPLIWDKDFRRDLLLTISRIGIIIEGMADRAQDIEGVYVGGKYYVVQARPQV